MNVQYGLILIKKIPVYIREAANSFDLLASTLHFWSRILKVIYPWRLHMCCKVDKFQSSSSVVFLPKVTANDCLV